MATLIDPSAGVDATVMRPDPIELRRALDIEASRAEAKRQRDR